MVLLSFRSRPDCPVNHQGLNVELRAILRGHPAHSETSPPRNHNDLLQGIPSHDESKTTGTLHIDMARVLPRSIRRPQFLLAPYPSRTCGDLDYKLQLELEWLELKRDY